MPNTSKKPKKRTHSVALSEERKKKARKKSQKAAKKAGKSGVLKYM